MMKEALPFKTARLYFFNPVLNYVAIFYPDFYYYR